MKWCNHIYIFLLRVWHSQVVKYVVVTLIGVVYVGFLGEYSAWSHWRNSIRKAELSQEIELFDGRFRHDQAEIRELNHNPKAIERIARERYFMKTDDEDIFVLSDNRE